MKINIEKGIPVKRPREDSVYPFTEMEVGDSFLATEQICKKPHKVRMAAHEAGKRLGRKYVTRTVEGGIRVWRTA